MQRAQEGVMPPSSLTRHPFLNCSFLSKLLILSKMTPGFCEPPSESPTMRKGLRGLWSKSRERETSISWVWQVASEVG